MALDVIFWIVTYFVVTSLGGVYMVMLVVHSAVKPVYTCNMMMFLQLVSTDGSSVSDSKSQGAGDSVHDMDVTTEKTPVQQTLPSSASAR